MATLLRRLRLKRVSLVDSPANEAARVVLFKSELGSESRSDLTDGDFAAVWTDADGRKQRKLPIHDAAHVRNALARWNQTDLPADVKSKARAKLEAKAKELGIGDDAKKMQPTGSEVNVDEFVECKGCKEKVKKGDAKCSKCGAPMMDEMDKSAGGRPKEGKMDEKLKADLDAATAKIEALTKERDELQKKLDTPEEIEKRKLAALPESVRKQLETQAADIQKLRSEKAEAEQTEAVRKDMPQLPGKPEDTGKLLKRVKDVISAEDFEALSTMLKAASAQIEKGELYREVGKSGDGAARSEAPLEQINRLVAELVSKSKDMKLPDAMAQVMREHPDIYAAYARSVTVGANADAD